MMRDPTASPRGASAQALSSPNCSPNLAWCSLNLPELLPEFAPGLWLWGRPQPARWAWAP